MDTHRESRPGDEGFRGFEMQIPENCVEYMVVVIDSQGDRAALKELTSVRKAALQLRDSLTEDYIWQRDAFSLELKTQTGLAFLHGKTDYGDNIEDEWLAVYLLRELGKGRPNLWIRVFDSDGEFLLVEAARMLPKWLNPEIDENRVWIHDGRLRIIQLSDEREGARPKSLTLEEATELIRSDVSCLLESPLIEAEAFYRLEKYPDQIKNGMHHALVTIPRKLAYVLHSLPKTIAPATEAFHQRDMASLRPIFSPSASPVFSSGDLVTTGVRFTRFIYAQLKSQHFDAPPAWQKHITFADMEVAKGVENAQVVLNRLILGMKLTVSFELLAAKASESRNRAVRELGLLLSELDDDDGPTLPSDVDIRGWKDSTRDDDESWMDIDYDDLERELDGKNSGVSGFGDVAAQTDLRKMVSRFEAFLNDDTAGMDGAEHDEMDQDNGGSDDSNFEDVDSDDEDKEVSFDEDQFARMMREMMGLPPETAVQEATHHASATEKPCTPQNAEDQEVRKLMEQMEFELQEHGVLALDPTPKKLAALRGRTTQGSGGDARKPKNEGSDGGDSDEEGAEYDEGVEIDYNLAKNILESFKGQGALAGPAGNMLGMMGLRLPRDEADDEEGRAKGP